MKLVVVPGEPVEHGLLWRCLVAHDPVGLAVLGRVLGLRRAGDALGEVRAIRLRAEVEGSTLLAVLSEQNPGIRGTMDGGRRGRNGETHVKPCVGRALCVHEGRLDFDDNAGLCENDQIS